jgi:hypothetical protein
MIEIDLCPNVETRLAAEAQARGIKLKDYIAEKLSGTRPANRQAVATAIDRMRHLRNGNTLGGLSIRGLIHPGCDSL